MRAAAEVGPLALRIELDLLIGGDRVDQLDLEGLALALEEVLRLVARDRTLGEGPVARDDLAHLLLDRREILGRERLVAEEVVIEAVLDHRADGHLRAGPQRLHRFGQHMRGVVADEFERPRVVAGDEFERSVLLDRVGEIDHDSIDDGRDRALGEGGRDGFCDVEAGNAGLIGALRAIGESDVDHVCP